MALPAPLKNRVFPTVVAIGTGSEVAEPDDLLPFGDMNDRLAANRHHWHESGTGDPEVMRIEWHVSCD